MNKEQTETLRAIASDLNTSRDALLQFCDANDGAPDDFEKLGDGSPGSAMHTLDTILDGLRDMNVKFLIMAPIRPPEAKA